MTRRFGIMEDPSCRFSIWDNQKGEAVTHCGRLLSYSLATDAAWVTDTLNATAEAELDHGTISINEAVLDPSCRFEARDNEAGEPIIHQGRLLTFPTTEPATRTTDALNAAEAGEAAAGTRP
ncbi:hypothetical protein [Mesorhizobium sp. dw_380]|uniref:hypothetical protein n=1 Tax=Mesorhizobium sp. dw_380 TaxID=2812001 RepID=UPI001BDE9830|nr:hypothetical protein [Mesorhizobium sp. dw_380]